MTSLNPSVGLSLVRCPPTTMFHVIITTSPSVSNSTCHNHLSFAYLIFSCICHTSLALSYSVLTPSILFIPIIHLNVLISVLSSKFYAVILSAHVSMPHTRTGLMTVLHTFDAIYVSLKLVLFIIIVVVTISAVSKCCHKPKFIMSLLLSKDS